MCTEAAVLKRQARRLLSEYLNSLPLPDQIAEEIGPDQHFDPETLFEISIEEFTTWQPQPLDDFGVQTGARSDSGTRPDSSTELDSAAQSGAIKQDLVVIWPQPYLLETSTSQYVWPPFDGFGPHLGYAFSASELEAAAHKAMIDQVVPIVMDLPEGLGAQDSQSAPPDAKDPEPASSILTARLLPSTRFYRRQSSLSVNNQNAKVQKHDVLYGILLDAATHAPVDSLAEAERPVFYLRNLHDEPAPTHGISLFRWTAYDSFRDNRSSFNQVLEYHGQTEPLFYLQTQDYKKGGGSFRLGVLAKLTSQEFRGLLHMAKGSAPADYTADYLRPVISVEYGNGLELPRLSISSALTAEPVAEPQQVSEEEPQEAAETLPAEDTESEVSEEEPQEAAEAETDSLPDLTAEPEASDPTAPLALDDFADPVQLAGSSAYRCQPGYLHDHAQRFLVFEYAGENPVEDVGLPLLLDALQAETELAHGEYRAIEERFYRAPAELFGLTDLCDELAFLPGCFTACSDNTLGPVFIVGGPTQTATHVLIRLESKLLPGDIYALRPQREFYQLSEYPFMSHLPNNRPRLFASASLRPDCFVLAHHHDSDFEPANVLYLTIDLELSNWFELLDPLLRAPFHLV